MSTERPPSRRRLRLAAAAGWRPRAVWWHVSTWSFVALALAWMLARRLVVLVDRGVAAAVEGSLDAAVPLAGVATVAGLGVATVLAVGLAMHARRRAAARRLRTSAIEDGISPLGSLGLLALAGTLALVALRPGIAASARSVDASPDGLVEFWGAWAIRALAAVAGIAAVVGVIERLASARRVWQGLHRPRERAREHSRR